MEKTEGERNGARLVPAVPEAIHDGKDEMNFAEFPLGIIAKRADSSQKTLVFEDTIHDRDTGRPMRRKLTITGTDAFGLPTSTDDEVLLALIQLTKQQGFASPWVRFTRYQLIRLLRWPVNGKSYVRIRQALNRWHGVGLYYENSWRDRRGGTWRNESFHILDNVDLDPAENERSRPKPAPGQIVFEFASSVFKWNDTVFQSFRDGNLKSLDFAFVMGLKSAISRRLYRFLDKRLHAIPRIEFDLKTLAFEKIALSRQTPTGDLKRQLGRAIAELEEKGFLEAMPAGDRFQKIRAGVWKVVFSRAGTKRTEKHARVFAPDESPEIAGAKTALITAGVDAEKSERLARNFAPELIHRKISALRFLEAKRATAVSRNPAGFLIRSIEKNFQDPRPMAGKTAPQKTDRIGTLRREPLATEDPRNAAQDAAIRSFWQSLSENERKAAEAEAGQNPMAVELTLARQGKQGAELAQATMRYRYAKAQLKRAGKWPE
jgi:hypothetical protein